MSHIPQTCFQFPVHLRNVMTELLNRRALNFQVESRGGRSELILLLLPHDRFLIGRKNHGAIVIEKMEDLCEIFNTRSGENDLHCEGDDSIYLIPSMMMIFSGNGHRWGRRNDDTIQVPLLPLNIPDVSAYVQHLIKTFYQKRNIIEFRVSGAATGEKSLTIVVTFSWATGDIVPAVSLVNFSQYIHWSTNNGFCAAICGVGCWAGDKGAMDDTYLEEKLSLHRMRSMGYTQSEIANLLKAFRGLVHH